MKNAFLTFLSVMFLALVSCATRNTVASGFFLPAGWDGTELVQTRYGMIRGVRDESNTIAWKGIPYAKPPVGELRWKAPRDADPWNGTLVADRFGNTAPQMFPVFFRIVTGSEDCLYLNVWRPATAERNLPVYFYIHGGGNSTGSALFENAYGFAIAKTMNAVYVSFHYRLGPLGWFFHPALTNGASPEDASGNYGTLDIIQALRWVRNNISSFGGDSNRVIVTGESAGAVNILSLLLSPMAKGLFHGALLESGYFVENSLRDGQNFSGGLLARLLIGEGKAKDVPGAERMISNMGPEGIREYLYSRTPESLILQTGTIPFGMLSYPYIFSDGKVIVKDGYESFRKGTHPVKVPLIIGSNRDEYKLFLAFDGRYQPGTPRYRAMAKYMSLVWNYRGADSVASVFAKVKDQPPVYLYRFDWGAADENGKSVLPGDMGDRIGSCHTLEIPFFMGVGKPAIGMVVGDFYTEENRPGREKLNGAMMSYLNAFVHGGNPNTNGFMKWPSWNNVAGKEKGLVLDADFRDLKLSYMTNELTMDGILARMKTELQEPLYSEVLDGVTNWKVGR